MTKQTRLNKYLKTIAQKNPASLAAEVATEALEHDDAMCFLSDVLRHGCQSGIVGTLIYYTDTHAFYDRHYDEIEALRYELEDSIGEPLQPRAILKTGMHGWALKKRCAKLPTDLNWS